MNDHTTALVPLETWAYQSPLLRKQGQLLDIGLLAEALVYYDRVLVVPSTDVAYGEILGAGRTTKLTGGPTIPAPPGLIQLVEWFTTRRAFGDLLSLLQSGELAVYNYTFRSAAVLLNDRWSALNVTEEHNQPTITRILRNRTLERILPNHKHREKLYRAIEDHAIEIDADTYGNAISNAGRDSVEPFTAAQTIQALVDHLYEASNADSPPKITATIAERQGQQRVKMAFNVNFDQILNERLGKAGPFRPQTMLLGLIHSNRTLWSAASASSDLYLPSPLSRLTSAKLAETNDCRSRPQDVLDQLKAEVEFPDVRALVNGGSLSFAQVLKMRAKAKKFRSWLQTQADRDRDALIAYHHEVAKESGLVGASRKTLKLFGVIGGAAVGAAVGSMVGHPVAGAGIGSAVTTNVIEEAVQYLFDVAGKLDENWRPVVFGDWARDYVQHPDKRR